MDNLEVEQLHRLYPSNISLGTSSNTMFQPDKTGCCTYRIFVKPERVGELEWRFWYSNTVDSTWDNGSFSRANMQGCNWSIKSAFVAMADENKMCSELMPVLFDGKSNKEVAPAETFWSDSVTIKVSQKDYIVFTWCIEFTENSIIPITPDTQAPTYTAEGDYSRDLGLEHFIDANGIPVPNLFGAKVNVGTYLAFIGDSITQGCGTENNKYEHWVPKIAKKLGSQTSVWNLGLGYGRAQDAATKGAWLKKAMHYDIVSVCFGVNDILPHGGRSQEEIVSDLTGIVDTLKSSNPSRKVILFTVPPFDLCGGERKTWEYVNDKIKNVLSKKVDGVFDMGAVLSKPEPNENETIFGSHPNGFGGTAVAEAFCNWYKQINISSK
jgi:lysophospholipase L1-like esterase